MFPPQHMCCPLRFLISNTGATKPGQLVAQASRDLDRSNETCTRAAWSSSRAQITGRYNAARCQTVQRCYRTQWLPAGSSMLDQRTSNWEQVCKLNDHVQSMMHIPVVCTDVNISCTNWKLSTGNISCYVRRLNSHNGQAISFELHCKIQQG